MEKRKIKIKLLSEKAKVPTFGSELAAGADLYALLEDKIMIEPGQTVLVGTGIAIVVPEGYAGLVCARSGLSLKAGLAPANKVGVIDSDYRGEIKVSLHNHSSVPAEVEPGQRIAQLLIVPVLAFDFEEVDELDKTQRGTGGYGSTGSM